MGETITKSRPGEAPPQLQNVSRRRAFGPERQREFVAAGHRQREFFPHFVHILPTPGFDGFRESVWMCKEDNPSRMREMILNAAEPALEGLPRDIFFDRDLIWHERHFGLHGHIANATFVESGRYLYATSHFSDIVQRSARVREFRTQIDARFNGWAAMLLNALLSFADERGFERLYSPSAKLVRRYTDPQRTIRRELFERVYDRTPQRLFRVEQEGLWWRIDVAENAGRIVAPRPETLTLTGGKTVCVSHDIERGLGHRTVDPAFAQAIAGPSREALEKMIRIEQSAGVRATYAVVGQLLDEVREPIERAGHTCAFHSWDHGFRDDSLQSRTRHLLGRLARRIDPRWGVPAAPTLRNCRSVDLRLKGYRAPQSRITPGISDANLNHYNFEWLASSADSLRLRAPSLRNGVVKIPITLDDYDLHRGRNNWAAWRARLARAIETDETVVIDLHDCYAEHWLPHYAQLLDEVQAVARVCTLDTLSAEVLLANAI